MDTLPSYESLNFMNSKKLITRIKGGLGNQLFCYAAAKRLAIVNDAELVIDNVSGFLYDKNFQRTYQLDHFSISDRKANLDERLEPFSRLRRFFWQRFSEHQPIEKKRYIIQRGVSFDPEILSLKLQNGTTYFDGFAQSENYFSDIEEIIKSTFKITAPIDIINQSLINEVMTSNNPIAVHFRWYDQDNLSSSNNIPFDYYKLAVNLILSKVDNPHFFIFSDRPDFVKNKLDALLSKSNVTYVSNNSSDDMVYADFWLMSKCKHFIAANSTFSWWAAWLGEKKGHSIIITPKISIDPDRNPTAWGFDMLVPDRWLIL